ncbi:F-box protein At5g46170 [Cryptomeria japonica]|uniref:F-box protein At5g46170 n=1 Tax=Cryptomeria japonica TaxID=3369 RepID=UPI0025ACD987|nr:F-box protein At5g46170 [Cryptomeria japonica]XP_057854984.1 F-box protein At5g46170 [Cryptomeria japonica]XP_057854986.1 F-box protein At5g46170 [Cryptomeria japonica]XP_057854987.1 F-box protein At5g46170 [Cryptomeria japonica]
MGYNASVDHFESLPDSVLLVIFNKFGDIKALGRCCAVSKRFCSIALQVQNVVVKVDCVISNEETSGGSSTKNRGIWSNLMRFMSGGVFRPLQALQGFLGPKKSMVPEVSHHSPGEVLKSFKEVQNLRIELPGGELGIEDGVLLKWKAEFGTTLESCVILGASSVLNPAKDKRDQNCDLEKLGLLHENGASDDEDTGNVTESFYTNGGLKLKLRVVWTISSLIAASARHYLLQHIISEHPTLETLVLTDSDRQGVLCMNKNQLEEFREKPLIVSASSNRTQIPALNMKLWYSPSLELPCGMVLKGATLVAIRPSDHPQCMETDGLLVGAFEGPFKIAANLLAKQRTYLLEMNSF